MAHGYADMSDQYSEANEEMLANYKASHHVMEN